MHQISLETLALNFAIDTANGIGEWWPLIPAGKFEGRDKRWWTNSNPQAVIDRLNSQQADMPLDSEHSTELKGPAGDEAPARGWFKEYRIVDGVIEARVDLNQIGRGLIDNKEYRYYSPALLFNKKREVTGISSVGLTNKHNLFLPALNREQNNEDEEMITKIAIALGLAATASEADVLTGIATLKSDHTVALNRAQANADTPDPLKWVPKETHQLAMNRAQVAEEKIANNAKDALETSAVELVDQAITDGKVAPANRDHYLGLCRSGGMDTVKNLLDAAPKLLPNQIAPEGDAGKQAALSPEEKAVCSQLGLSEDEFLATKNGDVKKIA